MSIVIKIEGQLAVLASTTTYKATPPNRPVSLGDYQVIQFGGVFVTQNSTNQNATFDFQTAIVNDDAAFFTPSGATGQPQIAGGQTGWALPSNVSGPCVIN